MSGRCDVAIIGGGFGGTLLGMCLAKQGRRVVVLERETLPRFAIGESSTPLANWVLRDVAARYGLDELLPLCKYGTWKETYPELRVGPKRGFSFFRHRVGKAFTPRDDRANELLVAANPSEVEADTQWLRADVDAFFAARARACGVEVREGVEVRRVERDASAGTPEARGKAEGNGAPGLGSGWVLTLGGATEDGTELDAPFVIDASGGASPLAAALGLADDWASLATRSRALFSHFEGVRSWAGLYEELGGDTSPFPFPADDAALHHVTPEGWIWMLRFDHGVTSVGALLRDVESGVEPGEEWRRVLARYPSVAEQMAEARATRPLTRTGLLQRRLRPASGPDWALLPGSAYFIDPLLSPGNAHTLYGVERLASAFEAWPDRTAIGGGLEAYDVALQGEIDLLDALIHGCWASFSAFPLMVAYSMYYFAGAISSEVRRERGEARPEDGFLMAHDQRFVELVQAAHADLVELMREGVPDPADVEAFAERVRADIEPYNPAGLCDPEKLNLYPYV